MKFKNLRRPSRAEKVGISVKPPAKKSRTEHEEHTHTQSTELSSSDKAEYAKHIKYIQKTYSSQKWSLASLTSLLAETAILRRKWIMEEGPPVQEVLETFTCFKEPKIVSKVIECLFACVHHDCSLLTL